MTSESGVIAIKSAIKEGSEESSTPLNGGPDGLLPYRTAAPYIPRITMAYTAKANDSHSQNEQALTQLFFTSLCAPSDQLNHINTGLNQLLSPNSSTLYEQWNLDQSTPWQRDPEAGLHWTTAGTYSVLATWLTPDDCQEMSASTLNAYDNLLRKAKALNTPHIVRTWNYIPNINSGAGDNEEYKRFCAGRAAAYEQNGIRDTEFSSASALGHNSEGGLIYLIACKDEGRHFENPEQVSAYQYPREYGPKSPSFSRATLCKLNEQEILFLSGTASVEGHKSVHIGNIEKQLDKTLENITTLFASIGKQIQKTISPSLLKVYIRNEQDLEYTKRRLEQAYPDCGFIYLHADICRQDLLIEIDGHCWV